MVDISPKRELAFLRDEYVRQQRIIGAQGVLVEEAVGTLFLVASWADVAAITGTPFPMEQFCERMVKVQACRARLGDVVRPAEKKGE